MFALQDEVLSYIKNKVDESRKAICYVTDKVSYDMRQVILRCRKNYYGVFDTLLDEATGREKIWFPLTEHTCENIVKNIDIDLKDINLRARNDNSQVLTVINREILRDKLRKMGFGEFLDEMERQLTIDGTVVAKTYKVKNKVTGKEELKCRLVDLLNFFIDPQAYSIADTAFVVERVILPIDEFKKLKISNKDMVGATISLKPNPDTEKSELSSVKEVEMFTGEGLIPKYFITGNEKDKEEYVFGEIIASGLLGSSPIFHSVRQITDRDYKSYEECWLRRVPGRWYGRGIPEMLFMLQAYLNEVVNLRINNSRIFQLGMFKALKTSGVTNRSIQGLITGGVMLLDNLSDVEQFDMRNPAIGDSIADEQNIMSWSQKVTQSYEVSTGEQLPASTPATSMAIANQNVKSTFALIQEGMGMFLQRLIEKHFFPIMKETTTVEDIVRVTGDPSDLALIDETVVNNLINRQKMEYFWANGNFPDPQIETLAKEVAMREMGSKGKDRFFENDVFLSSDYDCEVYVTNEDFDKNTLLQNLENLIIKAAQLSPNLDMDALITEYLDILGLSGKRFFKESRVLPANTPTAPEPPPQTQPTETNTGNQVGSNANPLTPGQLIAKNTQMAMQGAL